MDAAYWLVSPSLFNLFSYIQDHPLRDGVAYSRQGPPTVITNQENVLSHRLVHRPFTGQFLS